MNKLRIVLGTAIVAIFLMIPSTALAQVYVGGGGGGGGGVGGTGPVVAPRDTGRTVLTGVGAGEAIGGVGSGEGSLARTGIFTNTDVIALVAFAMVGTGFVLVRRNRRTVDA